MYWRKELMLWFQVFRQRGREVFVSSSTVLSTSRYSHKTARQIWIELRFCNSFLFGWKLNILFPLSCIFIFCQTSRILFPFSHFSQFLPTLQNVCSCALSAADSPSGCWELINVTKGEKREHLNNFSEYLSEYFSPIKVNHQVVAQNLWMSPKEKKMENLNIFQNPSAGKIFMVNHEATSSGELISEISSLKSALWGRNNWLWPLVTLGVLRHWSLAEWDT